MKPWNSSIWQNIEDVEVTDKDVNTAIRTIASHVPWETETNLFQTVMLSAAVIGYLRALKSRGANGGYLAEVVCQEMPDDAKRVITNAYGLIDPFSEIREKKAWEIREREMKKSSRTTAPKTRRNTKH